MPERGSRDAAPPGFMPLVFAMPCPCPYIIFRLIVSFRHFSSYCFSFSVTFFSFSLFSFLIFSSPAIFVMPMARKQRSIWAFLCAYHVSACPETRCLTNLRDRPWACPWVIRWRRQNVPCWAFARRVWARQRFSACSLPPSLMSLLFAQTSESCWDLFPPFLHFSSLFDIAAPFRERALLMPDITIFFPFCPPVYWARRSKQNDRVRGRETRAPSMLRETKRVMPDIDAQRLFHPIQPSHTMPTTSWYFYYVLCPLILLSVPESSMLLLYTHHYHYSSSCSEFMHIFIPSSSFLPFIAIWLSSG